MLSMPNFLYGMHEKIHKNILSAVYSAEERDDDLEEFNFIWNRFLKIHISTEELVILKALGCVQEIKMR